MKKIIRWIVHPFVYEFNKLVIQEANGIYTYPILAEIVLNKKSYYHRYMKSEKYSDMAEGIAHNMSDALKKETLNRYRRYIRTKRRASLSEDEQDKLFDRYSQYVDRIIERQEKIELDKEIEDIEKAYQKCTDHR